MNAESLQEKISRDQGRVHQLTKTDKAPAELVREVYFAALGRVPRAEELHKALAHFATPGMDRQTATEDVLWSLMNSAEFVFNH
jgi:hypothetical protein